MKKLMLIGLLSLSTFTINAQSKLDSLGVVEKLDYVIRKNGKFKTFKVIPITQLYELKKQVKDSISVLDYRIESQKNIISKNKELIQTKDEEISGLNKSLNDINSNIDKLDVFGTKMKISNYHTLVWIVISVLGLGLLFFLFQFKNSNKVTKESKLAHESLLEEFENYKKRAIEREQKIKRQLQDEINKNSKL
jgi:uncharacterized protein HemX